MLFKECAKLASCCTYVWIAYMRRGNFVFRLFFHLQDTILYISKISRSGKKTQLLSQAFKMGYIWLFYIMWTIIKCKSIQVCVKLTQYNILWINFKSVHNISVTGIFYELFGNPHIYECLSPKNTTKNVPDLTSASRNFDFSGGGLRISCPQPGL